MNIKKPLQPLSIMDWRGISNNDKPASHGSWLSICLQSLFLNKKPAAAGYFLLSNINVTGPSLVS